MQNVGPLRVKGAGFQVILADKLAQRQHAAVDVVHHGGTAGLAVQMRQAPPAAEHPADGAALGQVAALGHDQVGRRQLQRKRKLHLLIPRVIGGRNTHAALDKDHRPIPAVPAGAGDIEHFGMLPALGSAAGGIIGDAGAEQLQQALLFILADQMGQQGLDRAALHGRDRQVRRRHQQHAGAFFFVGLSYRQGRLLRRWILNKNTAAHIGAGHARPAASHQRALLGRLRAGHVRPLQSNGLI